MTYKFPTVNSERSIIDFTDRTALIIGGASGIGADIVERFVGLSASVIILDLDRDRGEKLSEKFNNTEQKCCFYQIDLNDYSSATNIIKNIGGRFGKIDFIVNSVRPRFSKQTEFLDIDEVDTAFKTMVKAPINIIKECMPYLIKSDSPSVVNISSTNSKTISDQAIGYHISKAALEHASVFLSKNLASKGVRVNCISPGLVDKGANSSLDDVLVNKVVPLGRAGLLREISDVVMFLCSDFSSYISGQNIILDGGMLANDHYSLARSLAYRSED